MTVRKRRKRSTSQMKVPGMDSAVLASDACPKPCQMVRKPDTKASVMCTLKNQEKRRLRHHGEAVTIMMMMAASRNQPAHELTCL